MSLQGPHATLEDRIDFIYSVALQDGEIPSGMTAQEAKAKMREKPAHIVHRKYGTAVKLRGWYELQANKATKH